MSRSAKKKRQQRAQSRLANAHVQQQQREQRQRTAEQRAETQWNKTLRQVSEFGAIVQQYEETHDGNVKRVYKVTVGETSHRFASRFRLQRWLKQRQQQQEKQQMSWAERHIQWMIDNNCDDHGNCWPS